MAFALTPNFEPISDGEAIWKLKELLVTAGWVVRNSGTGTGAVYNAAGDAHAPGGPYAGTLDLATSWFVIRQPVTATPRREFLFFRPNTTHGVWRIFYSSDGTGFTGGAPNATTPPTATDAPVTVGTDGGIFNAPSGTSSWLGPLLAVRTYRVDYLIGDTTEGFSFLAQFRKIGSNACHAMVGLDVLQNANASDADGAVVFVSGTLGGEADRGVANESNTIYTTTDSQISPCCRGWYAKGTGSQAWVNFPFPTFGFPNGSVNTWEPAGNNYPPGADSNGRFPSFPMIYGRGGTAFATQRGTKGRSRIFKYEMQKLAVRPYGDKSRWIMGSWSIPWDGSTEMAI
jgi:hypothetical protein